jgi:outer membrane protein TolC
MRRALPLFAAIALLRAVSAPAAPAWPAPAAAERYVRQAFADNLALQSQALDVGAARARANATQGARQPRLDLLARYTLANGGRTIDVPSGDLINPAYGALNSLLTAAGRPANFPVVENLAIPLLREREQETKLRVTAPLFNAELSRLASSRQSGIAAATAQQAAARRELRLGVLAAYYTVLRAQSAEQILTGSLELTAEALRTARVLFSVDQATEDRVLRAEADDLAVNQQLADATRDRLAALTAFNALLHRPLDAPVDAPFQMNLLQLSRLDIGKRRDPGDVGAERDRDGRPAGLLATELGHALHRALELLPAGADEATVLAALHVFELDDAQWQAFTEVLERPVVALQSKQRLRDFLHGASILE